MICLQLACRNYQSSKNASSSVMVCTASLECLLEVLSSTPAGSQPTELPNDFQSTLKTFCGVKRLPSTTSLLHLDGYDSCKQSNFFIFYQSHLSPIASFPLCFILIETNYIIIMLWLSGRAFGFDSRRCTRSVTIPHRKLSSSQIAVVKLRSGVVGFIVIGSVLPSTEKSNFKECSRLPYVPTDM